MRMNYNAKILNLTIEFILIDFFQDYVYKLMRQKVLMWTKIPKKFTSQHCTSNIFHITFKYFNFNFKKLC